MRKSLGVFLATNLDNALLGKSEAAEEAVKQFFEATLTYPFSRIFAVVDTGDIDKSANSVVVHINHDSSLEPVLAVTDRCDDETAQKIAKHLREGTALRMDKKLQDLIREDWKYRRF